MMEEFEAYRQGAIVLATFTGVIIALGMIAELLAPRRTLSGDLGWRWVNNFSLATLTWLLSTLAATAVYVTLASVAESHDYGLLPRLELGFWPDFAAMLLVTQFIAYLTHVAFHHLSWLWPLHAVHHSDIDVDVTTGYRHHPLEPLVFLPFTAPVVFFLGASPEAVLAYQLLFITVTVFSHANLYVPAWLDRYLGKLIITPDFHRLHHCSQRRHTNSNYGTLVPWFDYLFNTASRCEFDQHPQLELGLEYARDPRSSRIDQMILHPPRPKASARE